MSIWDTLGEVVVGTVTGGAIAGPGGALPGKPVGLVHLAGASDGGRLVHAERRFGDIGRAQVRRAAVAEALGILRALADRSMQNLA